MVSLILLNAEKEIKEALQSLFSASFLEDKIQLASSIDQMPGLDLFITPVPWEIGVGHNILLNGLSENMRSAVHDIRSQLIYLAKKFPPKTIITLEINIKRLVKLNNAAEEV